jgi:hypothetical protein
MPSACLSDPSFPPRRESLKKLLSLCPCKAKTYPFVAIMAGVINCVPVDEAIAGEDTLERAQGGQWSYPFLLQEFPESFRSAKGCPPCGCNDVLEE